MKIAIIGDLHGKNCYKKLLKDKIDSFDKIIFMGDYSDDSWITFTDKEIVDNLKEVIEFKKKYKNKVELLIGNHDFQYIVGYPTAHIAEQLTVFSNANQSNQSIALLILGHI